ncbi:MAG: LptF/LptG family permease [Proteobacteria bacterium]|nr:LptF/LptG family permease [Pseudomonadota bacterium]
MVTPPMNFALTLPRYVLTDVVKPTLVALGIMLGLVWLLQSLRFLDLIINKGLGVGTFLHLTLLLVPMLLTIIVPLAVFAGCCYAFRRWQDDNELTAVLAGGHSPMRLLWPALLWAMAAVGVGYWIYLNALPASTTAFKDMQYQLRTQEGQLLLEEGTFNQIGDNLMVYLKKRLTPTTLELLLVHDTRTPAQPVTWYARRGHVQLGPDGYPQLVLEDGIRQEIGKDQVSMLEFKSYNLDIRQRLGTQMLQPREREQEEYSLGELLNGAATTTDRKVHDEMLAEANKRLLWPLTPLPLVLLAAAWLLRAPRRHTSSVRLLVGAGVGAIIYQSALMTANSLVEGGSAVALYGQWLLPVATVAFAVWLGNREKIFG